MSDVIDQEELLKKFGYTRPADLRRCLDDQKIPYHLGKAGKIVTTIQALNSPLVGQFDKSDSTEVSFR